MTRKYLYTAQAFTTSPLPRETVSNEYDVGFISLKPAERTECDWSQRLAIATDPHEACGLIDVFTPTKQNTKPKHKKQSNKYTPKILEHSQHVKNGNLNI